MRHCLIVEVADFDGRPLADLVDQLQRFLEERGNPVLTYTAGKYGTACLSGTLPGLDTDPIQTHIVPNPGSGVHPAR